MSIKRKVETPLDLQVFFHDVLGIAPDKLEAMFEFGESKDGWIYAKKQPKAWLESEQFKALARAVTEIGGEYVRGEFTFRVPGPAFKKPEPPVEQPKQPLPLPPTIIAPGYYPNFPIEKILSPQHCFRINIAVGIEELMVEINAAGRIIEPLICKPSIITPNHVYLGPGERRLLAAKQLGMKTVPIIVDDFSDIEFDKIRLLENMARKDLTDLEIAHALDYMLRTYPLLYPTQEALANDMQKSQEWISRHLAILQLEQANIMPRGIMEKITEHQARAILSAPQEKQKEIAQEIEEEGKIPSVREISSTPEIEPSPAEAPSTSKAPTPETSTPKPEFIDIGEFECPECHLKYHIKHVAPNLHRLELVRKA